MKNFIRRIRDYNWKNWWDYNWKWVVLGWVIIFALIWLVRSTILRKDPKPDYIVGYGSSLVLSDEVVEQLQNGLAAYGRDVDGDGQVLVEVRSYILDFNEETYDTNYEKTNSYLMMIMAEASYTGYSFWIVEEPEIFQTKTDLLIPFEDGSLGVPWTGNALMSGLDLFCDSGMGTDLDWQLLLGDTTLCICYDLPEDELQRAVFG